MIETQTFKEIDDVPIKYEQRRCTDIFCIIMHLFLTVLMLALAFTCFNPSKLQKVSFPADQNGAICGIDKAAYPYVYFANPPDQKRRVCVSECPKQGDTALKCVPSDSVGCSFSSSSGFEVVYYQNKAQQTRNGHFCLPTDEQFRNKLFSNSQLQSRDSFFNSLDVVKLCFVSAIAISLIYLILVQLFPYHMNYLGVIIGLVVIFATFLCLLTYNTEQTNIKFIMGFILLLIFLVILLNTIKNIASWHMHAIFLKYATKMVADRKYVLLYIPIFLLCLVFFIVLVLFEFISYWMGGNVTFDGATSLYHQVGGFLPVLLSCLLIVYVIWGLSFIKEGFNFCVSGQAVFWYYQQNEGFFEPFKLIFTKHFGSISAGSFMTGFFSVLDFIFDIFKPETTKPDPNACYTKFYFLCCYPFNFLFDLVRSDSMTYINLTGNPFCNSARYCEFLCNHSIIMENSQSTSRIYRMASHFLISGIMVIFALYIKGNISVYALLVVIIQTLFICTLFISIHADAAEAIQIVFLLDEELNRGTQTKQLNNKHRHQLVKEVTNQMEEQKIRKENKVKS